MTTPVADDALDQLFRQARTHSRFLDRPVPDALLRQAWDLARMGPTAANTQPARVVFVRSPEAKALLKPALAPGNVDKTMAAPVTAIVASDLEFYEHLPRLFPHVDARAWYVGNEPLIAETAARNSSLQGAYLILALRSLGLDCGPMSGFDAAKVDAAFFAGTAVRANFLVNIGYGDPAALHPRNPRLDFDEACRIA
ncbi:MAG: malonic semialdehyde reductase [Bacteroidales bacterium]